MMRFERRQRAKRGRPKSNALEHPSSLTSLSDTSCRADYFQEVGTKFLFHDHPTNEVKLSRGRKVNLWEKETLWCNTGEKKQGCDITRLSASF